MKIGIPRGLVYFRYGKILHSFLDELGMEVIVSEKTNKKILDDSLRIAPNEICLPMKLYFGHVNSLKDKVDCIILPRVIRDSKRSYPCPRIKNVNDVIKECIPGMPRVIEPVIDTDSFSMTLRKLGLGLRKRPLLVEAALRKAQTTKITRMKEKDASKLTIAVLGHGYQLHDEFLNGGVLRILKEMGATVLIGDDMIISDKHKDSDKIFWSSEKEVLDRYATIVDKKLADGVVHLSSFNCGVAGVTQVLIGKDIPYLKLVIDEHTSKVGLETRIEAFIDCLRGV